MALGALTVSQVLVAGLQVALVGLQVPRAGLAGGGHVVDDARSFAAASSWIAIAPKLVCGELESLAEHRAATGIKSAAIVPIESICDGFPAPDTQQSICGFLKSAAARGGAQFVLLVGDAGVLPPGRMRIGSTTPCITDSIYADDDGDSIPERAVGRFPSADAPLVRQYADRIVAYERDSKPAGWRRRISFLAAQGGFGAVIDSALDSAVSGLLDRELPAAFDLRVLRPDANSPFGVPRKSEKNALRDLWESGSLVFLYAGHGSRNGMHTADAGPFTRTIFTTSDARQLSIRGGAPFVMMFACNTTEFQDPKNPAGPKGTPGEKSRMPTCLGEALLVNPNGAIAVLGASEVSHPYPDLLLAHGMNDLFRSSARARVGEMIRTAKVGIARGEGDFRKQVDSIAGMFGINEAMRGDLVRLELSLYNLLGDPALVLQAPDLAVDLTAPKSVASGSAVEFEVRAAVADGSSVVVSLNASRGAAPAVKGYPAANDRVLDQTIGVMRGGKFSGRIEIPKVRAGLAGGRRMTDGPKTSGPNTSGPNTSGPNTSGPNTSGTASRPSETMPGRSVVLVAEVRTQDSQGIAAATVTIPSNTIVGGTINSGATESK